MYTSRRPPRFWPRPKPSIFEHPLIPDTADVGRHSGEATGVVPQYLPGTGKCEHVDHRVPLVLFGLLSNAGDEPLVTIDHYRLPVLLAEALLSFSAVGGQEEISAWLRHQLGIHTGEEGGIARAPEEGHSGTAQRIATANVNANGVGAESCGQTFNLGPNGQDGLPLLDTGSIGGLEVGEKSLPSSRIDEVITPMVSRVGHDRKSIEVEDLMHSRALAPLPRPLVTVVYDPAGVVQGETILAVPPELT